MSKRWVRGCLVVVLVIVPGTVLAAVSGLGFLARSNTAPEDVGISISAPHKVPQGGDEYQIVIRVENLSEQTQFLDRVDF